MLAFGTGDASVSNEGEEGRRPTYQSYNTENYQLVNVSKYWLERKGTDGCPTTNLVSPEAVPAAKPFARSVAEVRVFLGAS